MLQVTCENCGKGYQVKESLAGKRVRCRACGTAIAIELPEPDPVAEAQSIEDLLEQGEYGIAAEPRTAVLEAPIYAAPTPTGRAGSKRGAVVAPEKRVAYFRSQYQDRMTALDHFSRAMSGTFSRGRATGACHCCGREGEHDVYEIGWLAAFDTGRVSVSPWTLLTMLSGSIMLKHQMESIEYQTYHPICRRCRTMIALRGTTIVMTKILTSITIILSLFGVCISGMMLDKKETWPDWFAFWIVLGVLSLVAFMLVPLLKRPPGMKHVGPRPFYRQQIRRVG